MVTKLRLATLAETGTVVGRLSAYATVGAIVGTVLTGFVFVANVPISTIVLCLGGLLVVAGAVLTVVLRGARAAVKPVALALVGATLTLVAPRPCEVETAYHCARVVGGPQPRGRTDALPGPAQALVRRSERPDLPGVRVHQELRRRDRRQLAGPPAAGRAAHRWWRPDHAALPDRDPAGQQEQGVRDRRRRDRPGQDRARSAGPVRISTCRSATAGSEYGPSRPTART